MSITTIDGLVATLARGRAADDGEDLDLLAHALQCAELLRHAEPDDLYLLIFTSGS